MYGKEFGHKLLDSKTLILKLDCVQRIIKFENDAAFYCHQKNMTWHYYETYCLRKK